MIAEEMIANPFPRVEEMSAYQRRKRKRKQKKKKKQKQKRIRGTPYKTGDQVNLMELLCNKNRDYLINNKGDKINVCDLEDKVVALYFYEDGFTDDLMTTSLTAAYQQLVCVEKRMFEVVLIYMYDSWNTSGRTDSKSFKTTFQTMPWLALPFKDINSSKLPDVFRYPFELDEWYPDPSLVIIGPRGEFVVPFGAATVFKNFGIEAYPFTCEKAYKMLAERVKNIKLEMLWDPDSFFVRDCVSEKSPSEEVVVPFADIVGKRIIVFCESRTEICHVKFRLTLLERYKESKGGNDEFEVIYFKDGKFGPDVPWLIPPPCGPCGGSAQNTLATIFYLGYGILVFDPDGRVVRATTYPSFEDSAFPFYAGSLEEELRMDLIHTFQWDYSDVIFRS